MQPASRFGSPSLLAQGPLECAVDGSSDSSLKKKGGLFRSLKRIGNLFSVHSTSSISDAQRRESNPSRNVLEPMAGPRWLNSCPELPSSVPSSISCASFGKKEPRLDFPCASADSSMRDGSSYQRGHPQSVSSLPVEPHSPCSPFPTAFVLQQQHSLGGCAKSAEVDIRCQIRQADAALPALQPQQQQQQQQQAACSPIPIRSLLTKQLVKDLSRASSNGIGIGKLEGKLPATYSAPAPAPFTSSPPEPLAPAPPVAIPAPAAAFGNTTRTTSDANDSSVSGSQAVPPATTTLLAESPALPRAMRRDMWRLEDYQVIKRLYKGGSASVYKAKCLRSGLPVALKCYFLRKVPRNCLHMIKREIELQHRLVHPHVVQLYGAFLDGDRVLLVQEYCARGDLFRLLRQLGGRMGEQQASELVMRPFLDALAYLHSQGVCHRDVKPENILFTDQWVLKLADFGVSIDLNEERAVTRAGTVDYMAPEVSRCPLKTRASDNKDDASLAYTAAVGIWAAGVLAYELLVGFTPAVAPQLPVAAPTAAAAAAMAPSLLPPAAAAAPPFPASLSPAARGFISAALAPNPGDRPTAAELLRQAWIASPPPPAAAAAAAVAPACERASAPAQ